MARTGAQSVRSRLAPSSHQALLAGDPSTPWWQRLDAEFYRAEDPFELDRRDRLRVGLTAALDVAVRTVGSAAVGAIAIPSGYGPRALAESMDDLPLYAAAADCGDPARFFRRPPKGVAIRRRRPWRPYFDPRDGTVEDLEFESPYIPFNPRVRESHAKDRANNVARARYWRHNGAARPTVLALHGFVIDPYWINEWFVALPWFYKRGYDVLAVTLPYHGRRQSRFSLFSGQGFFGRGLSALNEAFGQAVCDIRVFMDHLLDNERSPRVGITGVSLGGYTSALVASVDERLSFALPNVPVGSVADLMCEWQPMASAVWALLEKNGRTVRDLRHMLAVHNPLSWQPLLSKQRRFIVGGAGDRLAPPKHARLLWEHWDHCGIHWFPGSHLLHLDRGDYLREIRSFFDEIAF
ncbi:MAG: hypothetical protein U0269_16865 [Polyangiales bacterium]